MKLPLPFSLRNRLLDRESSPSNCSGPTDQSGLYNGLLVVDPLDGSCSAEGMLQLHPAPGALPLLLPATDAKTGCSVLCRGAFGRAQRALSALTYQSHYRHFVAEAEHQAPNPCRIGRASWLRFTGQRWVSTLVRMPPKSSSTKACRFPPLRSFLLVNWPLLHGIPSFPCPQATS